MTTRVRAGAVALVAAAASGVLAETSRGWPGPREGLLVRRLNHRGGSHLWWWPAQQLGTPWVLPVVAVLAVGTRHPRLALAAALALPLEKAAELGLRRRTRRPRPGVAVPGTVLRDDAPDTGSSYPSGHSALAACATTLLWPHTSAATRCVLGAVVTGVGCARLHQGAHYAGDVVGGTLLGVAVGSTLTAVLGADR